MRLFNRPSLAALVEIGAAACLFSSLACQTALAHERGREGFEVSGFLARPSPDILGVTLPVKGSHIGDGSTLTFQVVNGTIWSANSTGALCSTKYGSGVINAADSASSTISFAVSGIGCSDGVNAMSTMSFVVTAGTGKYLGATGGGTFSYGEATGASPGSSVLVMDGVLRRP